MLLFRVDLPYLCCGLYVKDERVVEAAPIMGWTEGKHINFVKDWVKKKGGTIEELSVSNC